MLLSIVPPQRTILTDSMEISPDGRKLAFVGISGGKSMLRIRDLGSDEVQTVAGTETAESPFWSPDSRFVGFYSRGKLRRVELATGSIEVLCDAELGRGGSWGSKGDILFTPKSLGSIYRVAASGGAPAPAARLEPGDIMHRWPFMLPDGRRFLFWVRTDKVETTGIYLGSLDSPERKFLLRNGAAGQFLPPDTVVFVRGEALLAQRFDLDRGEPRGDPEAVTRPVMRADVAFYRDLFSVSRNGILVFRPGSGDRRLVWVDRRGNIVKAVGPAGVIMNVSLSFDNKCGGVYAPTVGDRPPNRLDARPREGRRHALRGSGLDAGLGRRRRQASSIAPKGRRYELRRKYLRDQRVETLVSDNFATPYDASADGRNLIFTRTKSSVDIGVVGTQAGDTPQILLSSEHEERNPAFSPDGRWFVYSSSEPGQYEIFVRRLPMTDEKWAISSGGGLQAMWSRDGKEIFYVGARRAADGGPGLDRRRHLYLRRPAAPVPDVRKTEQRLPAVCRFRRWSALSDGQAHAGFRLGAFPRAAELEAERRPR